MMLYMLETRKNVRLIRLSLKVIIKSKWLCDLKLRASKNRVKRTPNAYNENRDKRTLTT